jgi:hypothetical protein
LLQLFSYTLAESLQGHFVRDPSFVSRGLAEELFARRILCCEQFFFSGSTFLPVFISPISHLMKNVLRALAMVDLWSPFPGAIILLKMQDLRRARTAGVVARGVWLLRELSEPFPGLHHWCGHQLLLQLLLFKSCILSPRSPEHRRNPPVAHSCLCLPDSME